MKKTLYQILGVDPKASQEEIEAAYNARIDELKSATLQDPNKLRVLQQSMEILADANRRAAYDASLVVRAAPAQRATQVKEPEPTFLQQWGTWIGAGLAVIMVGIWWGDHGATPPPQKLPPPTETAASRVMGEWSCADAITGRTSRYNFRQNGALSIAGSDGQAGTYKYELDGKTLKVADPGRTSTIAIEELVARKMILNTGTGGQRVVCTR